MRVTTKLSFKDKLVANYRGVLAGVIIAVVAVLIVVVVVSRSDSTVVGRATWPLIDGVAADYKPGVLLRTGVDLIGAPGPQTAARLQFSDAAGLIGIAPGRHGQIPFDQIQFDPPEAGSPSTATMNPFVIVGDEAFLFAESADLGRCDSELATPTTFQDHLLVEDVDGIFRPSQLSCRVLHDVGGLLVGQLPVAYTSVAAFGVLIDGAQPADSVDLSWLALANSQEPFDAAPAPLRVVVTNQDRMLAAQSATIDDDAALSQLQVRSTDGSTQTVTAGPDGEFIVDPSAFGAGPLQLALNDYGLDHYPHQGQWLDPTRLTRQLVIDTGPEFETTELKAESARLFGQPHRYSTWNGHRGQPQQEYHGQIFLNNFGNEDRDRLKANPNGCFRASYLGGSRVQAAQTRIDQHPSLIAEANLNMTAASGCFEIIPYGSPTQTVENLYDRAVQLRDEFGVSMFIFAIHNLSLCFMDDTVYQNRTQVDPTTPLRWRLIDGEMRAPVARRDAIPVEADPEFEMSDHCWYDSIDTPDPNSPDQAEEWEVIRKLGDLLEIYEQLGDGVEMVYINERDVIAGKTVAATNIAQMCAAEGFECNAITAPDELARPGGSTEYSRFLYRYMHDDHPNVRANQHIADELVRVIEAATS